MLVNMIDLLKHAQKNGYAVLAASMQSEGNMKVAIQAAEENHSPIILNHRYDRFDEDFYRYGQIARQLAERTWVPVAINQDHGSTVKQNMWAIRAGYTGIMIDRQTYPLEKNIKLVREMTSLAHTVGVTVESELGVVGLGDAKDIEEGKTKPEEALRFVKETGIDCLAVCIGTTNSFDVPKDQLNVKLDLDLLQRIMDVVDIPLVLHGGSGVPDEMMSKACKMGVCKVNVGSDFRLNARNTLQKHMSVSDQLDYWRWMDAGYKERMAEKMNVFGSVNQALSFIEEYIGK